MMLKETIHWRFVVRTFIIKTSIIDDWFVAYINFTEIDVKMYHEKTPQDFSTGVEFIAICLIYVKR